MNEFMQAFWQAAPTFIFGIVAYVIKKKLDGIEKKNENREKFTNAIAYGSLVGLRQQIYNVYKETQAKGYILPEQYDILCDMFEAYTQLGGNHGVSKMMDEIKLYPSMPPAEEPIYSDE